MINLSQQFCVLQVIFATKPPDPSVTTIRSHDQPPPQSFNLKVVLKPSLFNLKDGHITDIIRKRMEN
jgi:hypothetical protein